jgi:hypothetical protein
MPTSRTTFAKRQKEKARQEKRAEKQARRTQRREQGTDEPAQTTQPTAELTIVHDEDGVPMGFDFHDFAK